MQTALLLIKALASLGWPAFAFTALFIFRYQIGNAIDRLIKAKIMGQEIELSEELKQLNKIAIKAQDSASPDISVPIVPSIVPEVDHTQETTKGEIVPGNEELYAVVKDILKQAKDSPKVALMSLSAELDKAARHAIARRGLLRGRRAISMREALGELRQYGFPDVMALSIKIFGDVRDQIVHGHNATDDEILQAIDSGLVILKAVDSLPAESYIVSHPGVKIYSDSECKNLARPDGLGVILEAVSPGGAKRERRIYATTKKTT